jgi:hypothetical protein
MNANTMRNQEVSEQIDDRDRRALEQYLTVLEAPNGRTGEYEVVSESGKSYVVNTLLGTCDCPDSEYRDEKCKHRRRVEFATGHREVPEDVDADPQLGIHVSDVATDGGRAIADGGVVTEAPGGCEVVETGDVWDGPHAEYDRYGHPTGEYYKRCRSCGVEVLEDTPDSAASHRDGCRHGDGR